MKLLLLNCKNFGTFKGLQYQFEDKAILIQGENLSEDSQESNGSGKSFIQAAIEYALFKTTSRKVNDTELINYDEDEAKVSLLIECPIRKEVLTIDRTIKRKGSSVLNLTINDEPVSYATVNDGNKFIIEWIGISAEDLQNYFIINKERFRSIFSSSNREKVDIINRFSKASVISGIDKLVQQDIAEEESTLSLILKRETSLQSKIDTLREQMDFELSRDFEKEKEVEIYNKEREINKYKNSIVENGTLIHKITIENVGELKSKQNDLIRKIEETSLALKQYGEYDDSTLSKLENKKIEINEQILFNSSERVKIRVSLNEVESTISDIEKVVKGSVQCPKCNHKFSIGDPTLNIDEEVEALNDAIVLSEKIQNKITSIEDIVSDLELKVKDTNKEIGAIESDRKAFYGKVAQLNSLLNSLSTENRNIDSQLQNCQTRIDSLNREISSYENKINNLREDVESIKHRKNDTSRLENIKSEIANCTRELKVVEKETKEKQEEIFNISQWIINFKKFNVHLANISLMSIQSNCNKFLKDIKSDIQVRWEGYKVLANKSLKEEITPYIIRDNIVRDFWSFSGGERARMEYAMIFTLQKMINSTNKWGGLSFTSMDEIMESIDAEGLVDLMKSLDNLKKTILVTTHVVNRSISNNIIVVKKINKVSSISYGL